MPSVFKPLITRYIDAEGHRVVKGTPGAHPVKERSKQWHGRFSVGGRRRRVPLRTRDKQAAQVKLADIYRKAVRRHDGLDPFAEHHKRPLVAHLDDFQRYLTGKGSSEKHAAISRNRVEAAFNGCRFAYIADVSASPLVDWLSDKRKAGDMGIKTSNYYLRDCKSFARWLVKDGRTDVTSIAHVSPMNAKVETGLERRPLTSDEFSRLVEAARTGRVRRTLSGPDRAMLYVVAAYSGLRARELASLAPEAFDLVGNPPSVTVEAAYSKRRRRDVQPLRPDVARLIGDWLADKPAGELLWAGSWSNHAASMVKADLEAARKAWIDEARGTSEEQRRRLEADFLKYTDASGRVADFHAFRHAFISNLAAGGVSPKTAQSLARHSTITLTMDRYTHLGLFDQTTALEKLPDLPGKPNRRAARATGTDGEPLKMVAPSRGISTRSTAPSRTADNFGRQGKDSSEVFEPSPGCIESHQPALVGTEEAPPGFEPGMADLQSTCRLP